ncbi:ATP-binding cassette domain-containing protein [Serinibacter arcticus]|uniref:Oligopeptide transport ATP-binding protein OppF n=1 Tax=Serinibacter arcticus TaxID=1655435 RepID=A0A4Z1EA85_9MICO|nr:ATP-binding cassette domain-containing protein [Serinibacter arcticus]TGO06377.1 Oligopeptide transport ATP-binding protein OppF [Serinibacter arcticus]
MSPVLGPTPAGAQPRDGGRERSALEASIDAIRAEGLTVEFTSRRGTRRQTLRAVDGVDLTLHQGETLALVGESGCGKSTLVRTIFGLNPIAAGQVSVFGQDVATATPRQRLAMRRRIQMVFQDPFSSLNPHLTAHEIIAEPLRINRVYSRERVTELFEQVGLTRDSFGKRPAEFSGGQRQRIGIARALALDPDVLVLDEPVSALDVSVQAQVLNLLADLQERLGLSYLFIAHDLSVIRHIATRVAVMQRGRIVELGTRDAVFTAPAHPYTSLLLGSVPVPDPHRRPAALATSPS